MCLIYQKRLKRLSKGVLPISLSVIYPHKILAYPFSNIVFPVFPFCLLKWRTALFLCSGPPAGIIAAGENPHVTVRAENGSVVFAWVAVKELILSYDIGKPHSLLYVPIMVT